MIFIGLDDTDVEGSPGTNQIARQVAESLPTGFDLVAVLRHQLLFDPRIPYTSKNGSASILVRGDESGAGALVALVRATLADSTPPRSDPGFCVGVRVPDEVTGFGRRCQRDVVDAGVAFALARKHGLHLEGVGGTNGGVIGALAAVGLAAGGEDGRVVHLRGWSWPDECSGIQSLAALRARGVDEVRERDSSVLVTEGSVRVEKRLRPAYRGRKVVLYVEALEEEERALSPNGPSLWRALKLP